MTNISTETVSLVQAADGERDGHARAPNGGDGHADGRAARGRRLRRRRAAKQAKIGARLVKMLGISPVAAAHLIGGNRTYVYAWMRIERSGIHDLRCDVLAGKIPLPAAAANTPRLNRSNVG
jgi:hypothetical protein